jgi:hypothetical protein
MGRASWRIATGSRCRGSAVGSSVAAKHLSDSSCGCSGAVLSFGPAERTSDVDEVRCRYPIAGGLLTRQPGGELSLSQSGSQPAELRAAVRAFVPRWSGTWYEQVQLRFHVAISRRYFKRLIAEAS